MDECEWNTDNNTDWVELKSTEKQVRTQNFSLGVGWPWSYVKFILKVDFKNYVIKTMS
jgi:hypothetical protein